jgi:hypothetical protein
MYVFGSLHLTYLCPFLSNKNRHFHGKILNLWLLWCIFLFRWCQIPPGHLQKKFAALYIVKTQLFLIALIVKHIVKFTLYIRLR